MRILFANKYFFPNGGTEIYLRLVLDEMASQSHEAIPFSVAYQGSWPSRYSPYFMPPPAPGGGHRLEQLPRSPLVALTLLERSVYSFSARRHLARLLDAAGPVDAALVLNIYNYMSPSILHTLARRSIPVAVRLGDYHLLCPNYQFLRQERPCFLCREGAYRFGLRHRCVKGSLAASAARVLAMNVQRLLGIWDLVDLFLMPCRYMRDRLMEAGFPGDKLRVILSPVRAPDVEDLPPKGDYILSFGRISREKGLDVLIRAYQMADPAADLVILGRDYDGEQARLEAMIEPRFAGRIRFPGFAGGPELTRWIGGALLSVVSSIWPDNAPLSVSESLAHATAVAGSRVGGIPEQIRHGVDGALFEPGDPADLARTLVSLLADRPGLIRMGLAGRERMLAEHDPADHVRELVELLDGLKRRKRKS